MVLRSSNPRIFVVMKFYYFAPSPNCRKVDAVFHYTGLAPERIEVDLTKGENRTPDYLALNPNAMVPLLVDGEVRMKESNAIMGYVCDKAESDLWPPSSVRYEILSWMFWEGAQWGPAVDSIVFERVVKTKYGLGQPDQLVIDKAMKDFARFARVLDTHLKSRKFVMGKRISIADFAIGSHLTYQKAAHLDLSKLPAIRDWMHRLNDIPAWQATAI